MLRANKEDHYILRRKFVSKNALRGRAYSQVRRATHSMHSLLDEARGEKMTSGTGELSDHGAKFSVVIDDLLSAFSSYTNDND